MSGGEEPLLGWLDGGDRAGAAGAARCSAREARIAREESATDLSPPDIRERLRDALKPLPRRPRGRRSGASRCRPPTAIFFRHIGLDPDVAHTPIEAAVLERMLRGGFLSGGLLEDVLLIALIDTAVAGLGARRGVASRGRSGSARAATASGSAAAASAHELPVGSLVVADSSERAREPVRRARRGAPRGPRARAR